MVKQIQCLSYRFLVTFKIPPTDICSCGSEESDQMGIKLTWWWWWRRKRQTRKQPQLVKQLKFGHLAPAVLFKQKPRPIFTTKAQIFLLWSKWMMEQNVFLMMDTFLFEPDCYVLSGVLGWGSSAGKHAWFQLCTDWTQVWDSKWRRQSGRLVCTVDKSVFSKPPLFWHLKFWCICGNFWAPGTLICSPENIWDVTL